MLALFTDYCVALFLILEALNRRAFRALPVNVLNGRNNSLYEPFINGVITGC